MSVYKPAKSRFYHYDFQFKGRRFHGSTGQARRRDAEEIERKARLDAAAGRLGEASQFTLDEGAGKWWQEVGKRRGDSDDVWRRLSNLLVLIPKGLRLSEITSAIVNEAIQRRRGQTYRKSKRRDAKEYLPSNATVNRDVIETLRPILRRAATHWGAQGLPEIPWKEHRLQEPRETVRIYSAAERTAWTDACGPAAKLAVRLITRYGLRFGELFFALDAYEADGPRLVWMKGRKRDVPHVIPLLREDAAEIAARISRARSASLESIWFDEIEEDGKLRLEALTYYGLQTRLRTASKRARIKQGRVIHGARHHAGTTIMRSSGNIKVTQKLLGHADIKSTMRYVHALEEDVRAALEADEKPRNSPEPKMAKRRKAKSA